MAQFVPLLPEIIEAVAGATEAVAGFFEGGAAVEEAASLIGDVESGALEEQIYSFGEGGGLGLRQRAGASEVWETIPLDEPVSAATRAARLTETQKIAAAAVALGATGTAHTASVVHNQSQPYSAPSSFQHDGSGDVKDLVNHYAQNTNQAVPESGAGDVADLVDHYAQNANQTEQALQPPESGAGEERRRVARRRRKAARAAERHEREYQQRLDALAEDAARMAVESHMDPSPTPRPDPSPTPRPSQAPRAAVEVRKPVSIDDQIRQQERIHRQVVSDHITSMLTSIDSQFVSDAYQLEGPISSHYPGYTPDLGHGWRARRERGRYAVLW